MTEQELKKNAREPGAIRRTTQTVGRGVRAVGRWYKYALIGDTRQVTQSAAAIRDRLSEILNAGAAARQETFVEACDRLGLSEEDVLRRQAELGMAARVFLLVAGVALLVFGYLPWSAHPISHGLFSLLVLAMSLTRYSVLRWRQAQCEARELMSFAGYWRQWWRL